jgi:DNA recombination protein Rad52
MAFSDTQSRQLKAKLDAQHVKTRNSNGARLSYVEGWHVIAEANRIFGFDGWDRQTLATSCIFTGMRAGSHTAAYTATVRVSVRAGDAIVVREGSGTGEATATTIGQAHELALKGAETDATKRALATFGNRFGLALYDPDQAGVTKPRKPESSKDLAGPWPLQIPNASDEAFAEHEQFAAALRTAMEKAVTIEQLFAIWESNVSTVRRLNGLLKQNESAEFSLAQDLVQHLKACAIAFVPEDTQGALAPKTDDREAPAKIDKSVLTISEPKRHRCKEHLKFVAQQPCIVCGRSPSHAHHVRFAQSRGLGLKVSDEFTVPVCATHHHQLHQTGNERKWWDEKKIDPLPVAESLWRSTAGSK